MNSLRAEARQRFGAEQQFNKGEDLQLTTMKLVTIAKFIDSETTVRQTSVEWPGYLDICDLVNAPVSNNDNKKATMTMNIVEFRHDGRGILCINRRVLMNFFDDFGFDVYWLHMLCWSAFGFFQQVSRGGIFRHCFRQTELWTILWAHECISKTTKVLAIERVAYQVSSDDFIRFLLTINYHKDLIDDWRFCSFLCGSSLVHRLEYSIKHNLEQIQHAEAITGHGLGAWHDAFSRVYPATDELVTVSRSLGLVIAALAGEIRDFCTARKLLHDLISPLPSQWIHHQPVQNLSPASSPPHKDDIADIAEILGSNIQSIGIQASVIQERGRIQQSVIFNLLALEDAKNSKTIALATRKDSYNMKAIFIVTMIFLPPTFFATLFAMPLLKWDDPKVEQPGFEIYWAVSLPTTAIVLSVWHVMSFKRTVFAETWKLINVNSEQRQQEQEHKNLSTEWSQA